jgi:hypothetical protein
MRLTLNALAQRSSQARFAYAGLAREQHNSAFTGIRLRPAPQQEIQLLIAADEGRFART